MIQRIIEENIRKHLFSGKAIIILGPRQVGKTTLCRKIASQYENDMLWLNGDEPDIRLMLSNSSSTALKAIIGSKKMIIIDEAQRIENIGLTLKLIVDNYPKIQVIVTGSSSFELTSQINEPLTGRKVEYLLYPFSFKEMSEYSSFIEEKRLLEHRMIYGYYPEVVNHLKDEKEILMSLSGSYLYKDLFTLEKIKKPILLEKLLQALALQIGSEVSYNELAQTIGADNQTVEKYIDLLEKAFVIFRLSSLSRNVRNEIKKGKKVYFYDNGIRNSIIKNFNPLALRADTGALWENFLISERMKFNRYENNYCNSFFWRTHSQQEIDYIEEKDGYLNAFEFKWNAKKKGKFPKSFLEAYPNTNVTTINPLNFESFVL